MKGVRMCDFSSFLHIFATIFFFKCHIVLTYIDRSGLPFLSLDLNLLHDVTFSWIYPLRLYLQGFPSHHGRVSVSLSVCNKNDHL